jgi:hypothetical protein
MDAMDAKGLFAKVLTLENVLSFKEENGTPFVMIHAQGWGTACIKLVANSLLLTDCNGTRWLKTLGGLNDTLTRFGYPEL